MDRWHLGKLFSGKGLTWLLLLLVLVFNFSLRWRLRDLPLERDEGEYAYAGQLILQGIPPYKLAWNMKFPGVYFAYAGLMGVFGQSVQGIHEGLILITSLSILLIFLLGRDLMDDLGGVFAAALFSLLCALPFTYGLAGHATHFVVLFVNLGVFALLRAGKDRPTFWILVAGLAFGGAILMKQHAAVFAVAGGVWLLWRERSQIGAALRQAAVFSFAVLLPVLLTFLGLAWAGVWDRFYLWTIQYARDYVSVLPLSAGPGQFARGFVPILDDGPWVWALGLAGIFPAFLPGPARRAACCGLALLLAGLVATVPGFYFSGHYFLMVMPGLALLGAAGLCNLTHRLASLHSPSVLRLLPLCLFLLVTGDFLVRNAAVWFGFAPAPVGRMLYGLNPFPESSEIARYVAAHTTPTDTVAIIGSEPQIYFLSGRHSATGYLYLYPLTEPQPLTPAMRQEFIQEIETNRPACIVYVNSLSSWVSAFVPGQVTHLLDAINDWWNPYAAQNYTLSGQVDIPEESPPRYFWDAQMAARTNTGPATISIYLRK